MSIDKQGLAAANPEKEATVFLVIEAAGFQSVLLAAATEPQETDIAGQITGDDGNAISLVDSVGRVQVIPWRRIRKIVYKK